MGKGVFICSVYDPFQVLVSVPRMGMILGGAMV